jgi:glycyl-tRNA synthetase beta chain
VKHKLLLEIGVEEIPADYLEPAANQIKDDLTKALQEKRIAFDAIETLYTVRRLIAVVEGVAPRQQDLFAEKKGPKYDVAYKDNVLTDVGKNFIEKNNITEKDFIIKEEKNGKFIYINIFEKGLAAEKILKELLPALIKNIRFPKSMRFEPTNTPFARPVRWLLCMMDKKPVHIEFAGVKSSVFTRGHKFLHSNKALKVTSAEAYFKVMAKAGIILSQEDRVLDINTKINKVLSTLGVRVLEDPDLLDKVASSVESVSVNVGEFDKKYLFLPEQVIITAMREHQRYFAAVKSCGAFTNYFVNIRDGGTANTRYIVQQHAKVLFSRLNDAEFFYKEDLKAPIEEGLVKLKEAIFISGLGTMHEKVERIKTAASKAGEVFGYGGTALGEAAALCKADLVTNMVSEKEYSGLRGFMGGVYLEKQGKSKEVCEAVRDHYSPNFVGDTLPANTEGTLISLIDKMDNIVGFFIGGFKPTGSKDPYAVRRQALAVIYAVMEKKIAVDVRELIKVISAGYEAQFGKKVNLDELVEFFKQRETNYLKDKGYDYDILNAVTAGAGLNLLDDCAKAQVLADARKEQDFNSIIFAVSRISNILPKDFKAGAVDAGLFDFAEEKALYEKFLENRGKIGGFIEKKSFAEAFSEIAGFKPEIDAYFNKVLVMDKDEKKKNNRLSMLTEIKAVFFALSDFSKLVIDRKE